MTVKIIIDGTVVSDLSNIKIVDQSNITSGNSDDSNNEDQNKNSGESQNNSENKDNNQGDNTGNDSNNADQNNKDTSQGDNTENEKSDTEDANNNKENEDSGNEDNNENTGTKYITPQTRTNITGKVSEIVSYELDNNNSVFKIEDYEAFLNAVNNIAQHEITSPKAAWENYFVTYAWIRYIKHIVHFTANGVVVDGK